MESKDEMDTEQKQQRPTRARASAAHKEGQYRLLDDEESADEASAPKRKKAAAKGKSSGKGKKKAVVDEDDDFDAGQGGAMSDDYATTTKKRKATTGKGVQRGNKGKLASMVKNMPLEIISCVLQHCDPKTLVALTVTAKVFRSVLVNQSAEPIWRSSFLDVGIEVPFTSTQYNLQQWAHLIFTHKCQVCDRVVHKVDYSVFKRLCAHCIKILCDQDYTARSRIRTGQLKRVDIEGLEAAAAQKSLEAKQAKGAKGAKAEDEDEDDEGKEQGEGDKATGEGASGAHEEDAAGPAAGSSTAAAASSTRDPTLPECLFELAWDLAPSVPGKTRYYRVSYIPDALKHSDALYALQKDDIAEFGQVARVDDVRRYPELARVWRNDLFVEVKVEGTRVRAYYDEQHALKAALVEDAALVMEWEAEQANAKREAKEDRSEQRFNAIREKLLELNYTEDEIYAASLNEGNRLFHEGANLSDRVWKLKKADIIKAVEDAKERCRLARIESELRFHCTAVALHALRLVIDKCPLALPSSGHIADAIEDADEYADFAFEALFDLPSFRAENMIKDALPTAAAAMEAMDDPLWQDREAFDAALETEAAAWWSEVEGLLVKIREVYGVARDVSSMGDFELLSKTVFGCRQCQQLMAFGDLFEHTSCDGHTIFIDSRHGEAVFLASDAIVTAATDAADEDNPTVVDTTRHTVRSLCNKGSLFTCVTCSAGKDRAKFSGTSFKDMIKRIREERAARLGLALPGSSTSVADENSSTPTAGGSSTPIASTSSSAAQASTLTKAKAGKNAARKSGSSKAPQTASSTALSVDVIWTHGSVKKVVDPMEALVNDAFARGTKAAVPALATAPVDGKEMTKTWLLSFWGLVAHACGHETLSSRCEENKPWTGCPDFKTVKYEDR